MSMKIAVTGASGNLGQRVTRIALAQGHRVVGIDKVPPTVPPQVPEDATSKDEWFRYVELDIRNYDQVLAALRGCDAVIHLAAIPNPGDYVVDTHNLNVVSSWNTLRAAAELGIERICQASSINAVGLVWGDNPIIDYLPMDEKHPCRPEDPYSLSKLVSEMQADTIVRRWPNIRIASIRLAWAVPNREYAMGREMDWVRRELWAWVDADESARAFVLGVTSGNFKGHETFFTIAPNTCQEELTADLVAEHWPNAEVRKEFKGIESLYDCSKAERLLGWVHKPVDDGPAPQEVVPAPAPEVESAEPLAVLEHVESVTLTAPTEAEPEAPVEVEDVAAAVPAHAEESSLAPVVETTSADASDIDPSPVDAVSAATGEASAIEIAVAEPVPAPSSDVDTPVVEAAPIVTAASPAVEEASPADIHVVEAVASSSHVDTPLVDAALDEPLMVVEASVADAVDAEAILDAQQPLEAESSSSSSSDSTSADGDIDAESALSSDITEPSETELEMPSDVKPVVVLPPAAVLSHESSADVPPVEQQAPPALPLVAAVAP